MMTSQSVANQAVCPVDRDDATGPDPGKWMPEREGAQSLSACIQDTFVVVPAYNESRTIKDVVDGLCTAFRHVVVVNDGSQDETLSVLRDTGATVLSHAINLGQGAAIQTGIQYALLQGARYIITFDADGQHRVEDALQLLAILACDTVDAVLGSRFLGATVGMPLSRRLLLKVAIAVGNLGHKRIPLTDAHNGLRAFNRRTAECIDITQNGMAHASEIIEQLRCNGARVVEHPVTIAYSHYSLAKGQSALNALTIITDLLIGRFRQ